MGYDNDMRMNDYDSKIRSVENNVKRYLNPKFPKFSPTQDKSPGSDSRLNPSTECLKTEYTLYTYTERDSGYEFKEAKNVRTGEYMWLSIIKRLRIEVKHVKCDIIGPFASSASFHCG